MLLHSVINLTLKREDANFIYLKHRLLYKWTVHGQLV